METPAAQAARAAGIDLEVVRTEPPSSAEESAALQGIGLGQLLRSIVVRRGEDDYLFVLVPGGRNIDWPKLRGVLGVKRLSLPDEHEAKQATGYERGAITPFRSSKAWPVVADRTVAQTARIAIGGGERGVNMHMSSEDLIRATRATVADVTRAAG